MSKERARLRAEREAAQRAEAERREHRNARRMRRSVEPQPPKPHDHRGRPDSILGQRRRRQNAAVAFVLAGSLVVEWILLDGWGMRIAALLVTALAVPVLVTLLFDRRN